MAVGGRALRRRSKGAAEGRCPPVVLAEALAQAPDIDELERVVVAELRRWPELDLSWAVVAPLVPGTDGRPPIGGDELLRALSKLPADAHQPVVVQLFRGEVVAAPCGVGSNRVLAVASHRDLTPALVDDVAALAAMIGLASRTQQATDDLARRQISTRFEEVVRFSSDAIFIVDAGGTIRYSAPSVTTVLGYPSVDLDEQPFAALVVDHQHLDLQAFLRSVALEEPRRPSNIEVVCRRADGTTIPVELTGANLLGIDDVRGIVVTVRDISARRELEEQLRHQAFHDPLTGLANRALFADRLDRAMRVRRSRDDLAPAVAFIDLDDFKDINDSLGHGVGDAVLATIANRIAGCLRGSDTAARLGGDEFALLVEDVPDERRLRELVARVVDTVSEPITVEGDRIVRVRASVGIAWSGADVVTADDLLRHADLAMYRDKSAAKAEVVDLLT